MNTVERFSMELEILLEKYFVFKRRPSFRMWREIKGFRNIITVYVPTVAKLLIRHL